MIIFTVTNKVTKQIFVGSTRNDLESQWEKMVAAAHQDLDYPLYREIRIHGEDEFTVEEWDRAESREELAELEQDAIHFFGADSLRGYKTSTVKILPKKKKRQRKSSIEKELASIFAEINEGDSNTPPSLAMKSGDAGNQAANEKATQAPVAQTPQHSAPEPVSTPMAVNLTPAATDIKVEVTQPETEKPKPEPTQSAGSRANAMVQMNSIEMSDDITAQLAAITAAADACLAGDNNALSQLDVQPEPAVEEDSQPPESIESKPADIAEKEIIVAEPICPKQLRIREAIERHRKQRAQRSAENQENERRKMAETLAELDSRIREMHTGKLAAVA
ncbi:GIY-YIG nuclease family protein [Endozoicomonas sp. 4G]|uniref:GIY-YIG nuclease family protein n=1 Tax=Endozoicomonas sp. 4G TaxID=2872754 RepID=UPI002078E96D|nr:GIY-YIG nuclease family protein [Endozoicomonas sp. 4G]